MGLGGKFTDNTLSTTYMYSHVSAAGGLFSYYRITLYLGYTLYRARMLCISHANKHETTIQGYLLVWPCHEFFPPPHEIKPTLC